MASRADFSMPDLLTMQKSYLELGASSSMQRLIGSKLETKSSAKKFKKGSDLDTIGKPVA